MPEIPICSDCHLVHPPAEADLNQTMANLRGCLIAQGGAMLWLLDHVGKKASCDGPNCGRTIYWVTHTNGRKTPYTAAGLNHFVDCPDRDRFRKGAK